MYPKDSLPLPLSGLHSLKTGLELYHNKTQKELEFFQHINHLGRSSG